MKRARSFAASLLFAALGVASGVRAQPTGDKAAAETLFDEGKRLMSAERYPEACPKLADSQRLDPGVGTLLNLALCYKLNGQTASAWSTYREAASQARAAHQDDREQLARDEAAALEKNLTRLTIEVSPAASAIPGLELKRDGALVPSSLWGVPTPVDPGVRRIDAAAPGKKSIRFDARAEGPGTTAKVVIPPLEDAASVPPVAAAPPVVAAAPPPPPPAAEAPPPAPSSDGSGQRTAGWVVGSVGAAAMVSGVVLGLLSRAQNEAADKSASNRQVAEYRDGAETKKTAAFVCLGVGAAALAGGIVLLATAPSKQETASAALWVTPSIGESEFGARLTGRF